MKLTLRKTQALKRLLKYSDRYEISIQFWPDQIAVFVSKDGVDLGNWGNEFDHAVGSAIAYLDRVNKNKQNG